MRGKHNEFGFAADRLSIYDFLAYHKPLFLLLGVCAIAFSLTFLYTQLLYSSYIDRLKTGDFVVNLIIAYTAVNVFQGLASYVRNRWRDTYIKRFMARLHVRLFSKLLNAKYQDLQSLGSGTIYNIVVDDAVSVYDFLFSTVITTIYLMIDIAIAATVLFLADWRFAVLALVSFPLVMTVLPKIADAIRRQNERYRVEMDQYNSAMLNALEGLEDIYALGIEEEVQKDLVDRMRSIERLRIRMQVISELANLVNSLQYTWQAIVQFGLGGYLLATGSASIGGVVLISTYLEQYISSFNRAGATYKEWKTIQVSIDRVNQLLNVLREQPVPEASDRPPQLLTSSSMVPAITLEDVYFSYVEGMPVLVIDHLEIRAGEKVVIVGRNGSGKSTLLRCIANLLPGYSGRIVLMGLDAKAWPGKSIYSILSYLPQFAYLLPVSIRDNVWLGARDDVNVGQDDLYARAVERSCLRKVLDEVPGGDRYMLTENGQNLSGGQRQLVALARAYMSHTPIMILDECFSAVDARTEAELIDNIMHDEGTYLIVSHRLQVCSRADRVLVMDQGRVIDDGPHAELLHRCELYRQLLREGESGDEGAWDRAEAV
ncbi:MAG TPA: ABC transporter ATP-binding protein [Firmicutes bacterium]|nr:ABC transporter ATP-binding protein [Bacillota bacterium]